MLRASEHLEFDLTDGWIAAGQPSLERLREVIAAGARIISLRTTEESHPYDQDAVVAQLGGAMRRVPTRGSDLASSDAREALYQMLDEELGRGGQVYFHCGTSNRIGALWALYHAECKGVDPGQALDLGRQAGMTRLEAVVREVLGLAVH